MKNMIQNLFKILFVSLLALGACQCTKTEDSPAPTPLVNLTATPGRYFAHTKVEDAHGVILPWYSGQNGVSDQRVRATMDILKRFPWSTEVTPAVPHYIPNGRNMITPEGVISIQPLTAADNGDLVDRVSWTILSLSQYYAYSGDPAALAHINMSVDYLLQNCLASNSNAWPEMVISVPMEGIPYGKCQGRIQLDYAAVAGYRLLVAYQMNPNPQLLSLLKHWGDLFVSNMNGDVTKAPWNRYAQDKKNQPENKMTGGLSYILFFLDELIDVTQPPAQNDLRKALTRGENYLRDVLLANWFVEDTWGRSFWDSDGVFHQTWVADSTAEYILKNRERFPLWKSDVRRLYDLNILRTSGTPKTGSGIYSGAWIYPESKTCCGESLSYAPMFSTNGMNLFASLMEDASLLERARRLLTLSAYDFTSTGYTEDLFTGGQSSIFQNWFKINYSALPVAHIKSMAYQPEILAPQGENHLLDSTAVIQKINYQPDLIEYSVFNAPPSTIDILKVSFLPEQIMADGMVLVKKNNLSTNGYTLKDLGNGDYVLKIRHDNLRNMTITGPAVTSFTNLPTTLTASQHIDFTGNQIYLHGNFGPDGGQALVKLDGQELLTRIDLWNPQVISGVAWSMNGLSNSNHSIEIIPVPSNNPRSTGNVLSFSKAWWSNRVTVAPPNPLPAMKPQKVIFGYTGRNNLTDQNGFEWQPALELVYTFPSIIPNTDQVLPTFWTTPLTCQQDECIYAYGLHATNFYYAFTVLPGKYNLKLHFNCGRSEVIKTGMQINVNDMPLDGTDLKSRCQNKNQTITLEKSDITPMNGIVRINFIGDEAFISAIELSPL